jgi:cytochrome b
MNNEMIWNRTTRLLHWAIALPVALNFFIDGGDTPHKILGYVAFGALVIRMFWGFISRDHANFKSFPLSIKEIMSSQTKKYPGHNPLASWAYIFIWICVAILGVTGFMMKLDAFWGEEWLEEFHESVSTILSVLVVSHFIGLILDSIKNKRKTWLGMITGKRNF